VMMGAILWTIGLLVVVTIVFTFSAHARNSAMVIHRHTAISVVVTVACLIGGLALVRKGLHPFDTMRRRLSDIRAGKERQLLGSYPTEVQPLVDDLNALLEHRDQTVRRAIAKAGDLAHTLKTPLAVLAHEADVADKAGQDELAAVMHQQIERMRRHMDYHLAHARAAASGAAPGAHCSVLASAEGLARTLLRLHAGRGLEIQVDVDAAHAVRGEREDIDEMLGNLLDNACKWAKSQVSIASAVEGSSVVITVDDDGPGLDVSMREAVLQRGVRADEASPGSGLGLAIVRDLAELYGGSIALSSSRRGGLSARLQLPS
jgi:signal transduction histidine kinase